MAGLNRNSISNKKVAPPLTPNLIGINFEIFFQDCEDIYQSLLKENAVPISPENFMSNFEYTVDKRGLSG
jgi:hypothetical protein